MKQYPVRPRCLIYYHHCNSLCIDPPDTWSVKCKCKLFTAEIMWYIIDQCREILPWTLDASVWQHTCIKLLNAIKFNFSIHAPVYKYIYILYWHSLGCLELSPCTHCWGYKLIQLPRLWAILKWPYLDTGYPSWLVRNRLSRCRLLQEPSTLHLHCNKASAALTPPGH